VFHFFQKRGFSSIECQDLTQETFFRISINLGTFRREAPFEAWPRTPIGRCCAVNWPSGGLECIFPWTVGSKPYRQPIMS
jgi:hypothetical protein